MDRGKKVDVEKMGWKEKIGGERGVRKQERGKDDSTMRREKTEETGTIFKTSHL